MIKCITFLGIQRNFEQIDEKINYTFLIHFNLISNCSTVIKSNFKLNTVALITSRLLILIYIRVKYACK
jgi:hypothetical protein